jgi:hypothetical protein
MPWILRTIATELVDMSKKAVSGAHALDQSVNGSQLAIRGSAKESALTVAEQPENALASSPRASALALLHW